MIHLDIWLCGCSLRCAPLTWTNGVCLPWQVLPYNSLILQLLCLIFFLSIQVGLEKFSLKSCLWHILSTLQSGMQEKCFLENYLKTTIEGLYLLKVYLFCIPIDILEILNAFGHISGQIRLTWPAKVSFFFKTCGVTAIKLVIFFLDFQQTKNMEPSEIKFRRAPCS